MERNALCALGTDAGQPAELVDQVLDHALIHTREPKPWLRPRTARRAAIGTDLLLVKLADHRATQDARDDRLAHGSGLLDVLVVSADHAVVGDRWRGGRRARARPLGGPRPPPLHRGGGAP